MKFSQVIFLFVGGAISTLEEYDSIFGLGFCLLAVYLAHKYDLLKNQFVLKVGLIAIVLAILVIVSESVGVYPVGSSLLTIFFILFFYAVFFLGESDWVRKLEANIRALKESKERLDHTLEEVEGHRNDLVQIGFTKKEIEVGRALVQTKTIDKQIAYDLGISMNTLRNHFKSMRRKTGAETKQQLIDAIRWYYLGDNHGDKQE